MSQPLLTLREVADYLRLSPKSVYRLAQTRSVPCLKVGGSWRFRRKELDDWVTSKLQEGKRSLAR